MRRAGDAPDEMTSTPRPPRAPRARRRSLSETDVAALLRGGPVGDRPELAGLTMFTAEVRALAEQAPVPSAALSALLAEGFDPAAIRAAAASPVPAGPTRSRTARSLLVRMAGFSLLAKVTMGTGVAVAAVAAASGTGVLPDVVQDRVTGIVDAVTPSGEGGPPVPLPAATAAPSVPAGPPTFVPAPRPTAVPSAARPDSAASPQPESTRRPAPAPSRPGAPGRPPTSRPSPAATPAPPAQSRPGGSPGSASSRPGPPNSAPPAQSRPSDAPESPASPASRRPSDAPDSAPPARSDGAATRAGTAGPIDDAPA